jgi:hypothetical protein
MDADDCIFLRKIAKTAHVTGKRLWLNDAPHLVIWSLYPEKKHASRATALTTTSSVRTASGGSRKGRE